MSIKSQTFPREKALDLFELTLLLIRSGEQFSICPFPNDQKSAIRTGWVVSWTADVPGYPQA